jgi:hypothetical protein
MGLSSILFFAIFVRIELENDLISKIPNKYLNNDEKDFCSICVPYADLILYSSAG